MTVTELTFVVISANEQDLLESQTLEVSKNVNPDILLEEYATSRLGDSTKLAPLLLPTESSAGLYTYSIVSTLPLLKNIRATRLAMACGSLATRFYGDVVLFRSKGGRDWQNVTVDELYHAACVSPDLRREIQKELSNDTTIEIPEWLSGACQQNYHDNAAVTRLASVMNKAEESDGERKDNNDGSSTTEFKTPQEDDTVKHFVAQSSLCLHCRGPATTLCLDCEGAYFCQEPRTCRQNGWSHQCLCYTWRIYTRRRQELSTFPLGDWHLALLGRDCQLFEGPYKQFLTNELGVQLDETSSWWRTEIDGWAGGESRSAQTVNTSIRRTYARGFSPVKEIPPDRPVSLEERADIPTNSCGLLELSSWDAYYNLRKIPLSSPVALLLTFPLTIYFAIAKYGQVPVTVVRMLKRPLRIHAVGIEKEMNFIDLFRELGYLLPQDLLVELLFVVRKDMLPTKSRDCGTMRIDLTDNLTLLLVSGTYGDDLDPNFDCGSGPPDMVIGLNAGLFAYDSWRSVVTFLYHHSGVVGFFTDYNEHSGMNCASLGGTKSRESLCVNPFRQPRAMPVMSMNLPQFSNGFIYVYNEQELDE